jgi:uncharacterized membrane protein
MFLSSLVLGIDWNARRELQRQLAALAADKIGGTAEGRVRMLGEVVLALERAELSWLYVACDQEPQSLSAAAGMAVVSLILVTRRRVAGGAGIADAVEISAALADRAAVTSQELVAIEVVWSPAAEDDRMSTAELEQHYSELVLIDPESIAGRIFCSYCGGVFAMELLSCPHCGAAVDVSSGSGQQEPQG